MKNKNKIQNQKSIILFLILIIIFLNFLIDAKVGFAVEAKKPEEKCGGEIVTEQIYTEGFTKGWVSFKNALNSSTPKDSYDYDDLSKTYKCKQCYMPNFTFSGWNGTQRLIIRYYTCSSESCDKTSCKEADEGGYCYQGKCYLPCKNFNKNELNDCWCGLDASEKPISEKPINHEKEKCCKVEENGKINYQIKDNCESTSQPNPSSGQDRSCKVESAGHSRFNPFVECKQYNFCSKDSKGVADFICREEDPKTKNLKCTSYVAGQDKAGTDTSKEIFKDNGGNVYLNCNYDWDSGQSMVVSKGENYGKCVEGMKVNGKTTKAFCCMLENSPCNGDENKIENENNPRICCSGLKCSDGKCIKSGDEEKKEENKEKGDISCSFTLESKSGETSYPVEDGVIKLIFDNQESKKVNVYVEGNSKIGFENYNVFIDCGVGTPKEEKITTIKAEGGISNFQQRSDCEYSLKDLKPEDFKDGKLITVKVELKKEDADTITCELLSLGGATEKINLSTSQDILKISVPAKIVYSGLNYSLNVKSNIVSEDSVTIVPATGETGKENALECLGKKTCEFKIYSDNEEIKEKVGDLVQVSVSKNGEFTGTFSITITDPTKVTLPIENVYLLGIYNQMSFYSDKFTIDSCKKNNTAVSDINKKEEDLIKECCSHYMEEAKVQDPNDPNKQKDVSRCYFNPKIGKRTDSQGKEEKFCEFNYEEVDKNPNAQCTEEGICIKGSAEVCDNKKDDNCDGLIDCEDPLCYSKPTPVWTVVLKSKEFEYYDCVASIKFGYPGCGIAQCGEYAGKLLCKCWISEPAKDDIAKKKCVLTEKQISTQEECVKQGGFCIDRQFLGTKILDNGLKINGSCDGTLGLQSITTKTKTPSGKEKEIPMNCGSCDVFCCKKNDSFKACGSVEGLHCCAYGCSNDLVCCNPPQNIEVKEINDDYKNYIKELLIREGKKEDEIKDEDIINKEKELINQFGVCRKSCEVKQAAIDLITRAAQQQQQQGVAATVYGTLLDQTCFYANIDEQGKIKEVYTDDKVDDKGDCPPVNSDKFKKVENLENNQKLLEQLKNVIAQSIDFLKTEYSKADNLLKNPTFENELASWLSSNAKIDAENYKLTPKSANVKNGYLAQYVITNLYQNDVLELSGFIKGKDCKVNITLGLVDINGNFIKEKQTDKEVEKKVSKEITGTDDFTEFKGISLSITENDLLKGGTRILVNLTSDCDFWVDDLLLLRTKKGTYGKDGKEERFASYNELCGQSSNGVSCDSSKGLVCVLKDNVYRCDCKDKNNYKWLDKDGCVEKTEEEKKSESNLLKNPGFEDVIDFTDLNNKNKKVPDVWKIVPKVPTIEATSDCKNSGSYGLKITYDSNQIMNSQVIQTLKLEKEGTYGISGYLKGRARIIIVESGKDPTSGSYRIFEYTHETSDDKFSNTFTLTKEKSNKNYDVVLWLWQNQAQDYVCFDDLYLGPSSEFSADSYEIKAEKILEFGNKLSSKDNVKLLLNSPNDVFVSSETEDDKNDKTFDVLYIADTNNKRIAVVNDFSNPEISYLELDKKPVEVVSDDKYIYVLLIDENVKADDYKSYIYVINKNPLSISKKITVNKGIFGLALTKDYLVAVKHHDEDSSKLDSAVVFFDKGKIISGQSSFTEAKDKAISIPLDVSTAHYEKNSVFIINKDDDERNKDIKELVYVQKGQVNVIKELEKISKPLRVFSLKKDNDYFVFVIVDNDKNDKIIIYNVTSEAQKVTKIGEVGVTYKIKSVAATNESVYVLSGEKIYRYPYTVKENKASIDTNKKEELGSKGSKYNGVLALKGAALTDNNVFFSVSDTKNYAVLLFDKQFNPINYVNLDSTPMISVKDKLFVAFSNNISEYKLDLSYFNSKKIDEEIRQYYYYNKHYYVIEEEKDGKKQYCIYTLDKLDEKTNPSKINCLDEKMMSIYVDSTGVYALTEKTSDGKWKIYSIAKENKVICEGSTGYPRTLVYDSKNKVFWIGVSANPSRILVSSDCKNFLEYKFDKNYDTVYLTKKNDEVYVLVSSKFNNAYNSTLYKLSLNKK